MSSIRKHSIYGTIYSYLGVILGFVINLLIYPKVFTTEQVGLFTLLVSYAALMASFAGLGLNMVGIKIFPLFRDEKTYNHGFLGLIFLVNMIGFILVSVIFHAFKNYFIHPDDAGLFAEYSYTIFAILFFYVLFLVFDLYYRVMYNSSIGILYKDVVQRLLIIIAFLIYYFRLTDFQHTVFFYVAANILPGILIMLSLMRDRLFHFHFDFKFLDRQKLKQIFQLNVHGILLSFASIIALRLDALMIQWYMDLSSVGVYFVTFNVATLILIPYRTMGKVSSIVISDAYKDNNHQLINEIARKSSLTLFILGTLLLLGIWGNIDTVFLLLREEYRAGMYVILTIGIANLVETSIGVSSQLLFYSGLHKRLTIILYIYLFLLVSLNALLIPAYGILGAAIATMLSKIIATFMKWYALKSKLNIQPLGYRHLIILSLGIIIYFLSTMIVSANPWLNFIFKSAFISLGFLLPVYFLRLSEDINRWVEKMVQKLL